ncbi:hypothetical protein [Hymenobacter properus]|uniref:Tetratricopeptide repeat protein n=1 Tax=Hymenobacter properus TaxID=2791026 RepID=A0A931BC89_9BACT|nr:hypothetical protein [Hymenobacter properus]MBF9140018.1 hypothetical protein [Hymenobacter properus]MBR7718825.1 hypothetical protein [Microvirga sp. SRT04]
MTRATLLQVLARPTALGPAEVRELEQLAQAFPYCQTAHLLLAKAAHDQGTMLAGQRLRRAATYAADRALLRRLIEEVEPTAPAVEIAHEIAPEEPAHVHVPAPEPLPAASVTVEPAMPAAMPAPVAVVTPVAAETEVTPVAAATVETAASPTPVVAPEVVVSTPLMAPVAAPSPIELPPVAEPTATPEPPVVEAAPEPETQVTVVTPAAELTPAPITEAAPEPEVAAAAEEPTVAEVVAPVIEPELPAVLVDQEGADIPPAALQAEPLPAEQPEASSAEEPDLPAQAPAIRPPAEAGEARFEFGLSEPPPPPPAYELPGLVDEWAAAAVTLSLAGPEPVADFLPVGTGTAPAQPALTPAAFTGDEVIGYGLGESSRLGFSMQLMNLLTDKAEREAAEMPLAEPPPDPLPPVGTFFEPDPLLLDHWATHRPLPPALPSSLDLINNFLKRQPRLTRPAMLPPAPGGQTDLSARSTRAEPDLVSENLARIFVRQGKTARAIEIYEKLMLKQPEKMAYFAAQIQSLQPSA